MQAILTADMEGFSTWMQRDERGVIELLTKTYYRFAERMVQRFGGHLFQKEGDAIWCSFPDADEALRGGLWILGQFELYNQDQIEQEKVLLRVGISWGEEGHDPLRQAKELETTADSGSVHFSHSLHQQLRVKRGTEVDRLGRPSYLLPFERERLEEEFGQTTSLVCRLDPNADTLGWIRDCLTIISRHGGELLFAGQSCILLSGSGEEWLKEMDLQPSFLRVKSFQGMNPAAAAREAGLTSTLQSGPAGPYRFLSSFEPGDSLIFFGRGRELRTLRERLEQSKLLLIYGKSGVGKTSLLRGGLQGVGRGTDFNFLQVTVEKSPRRALRESLLRALPEPELSSEEIWRRLGETGSGRWVLLVDQFEELFRSVSEEERSSFVDLLKRLTNSAGAECRLIVSLREDFLAETFALEADWPDFARNRMRLQSLSAQATRRCIEQPAALFGVRVEPSLVRELAEVLDQEGVHPAELQIILSRLYEKRSERHRIDLQDFRKLGGVQAMLKAYLDDCLEALPSAQRARAKIVLKQMVGMQGERTQVTHKELTGKLPYGREIVEELLKTLIQNRLVHVTSAQEELAYQLSHDTIAERITDWETPLELAQRHAQLTLRNEYRSYRRLGTLPPRDRLELLAQPDLALIPTLEERLMLVKGCVLSKISPSCWMTAAEHLGPCASMLLNMLEDSNTPMDVRRRLLTILAPLELEERALEALFSQAGELINPNILKQMPPLAATVEDGLRQALKHRFFGPHRVAEVAAGECWVGSTEESKQQRKSVTRPDLHQRFESEAPYQRVELDRFWVDLKPVTNAEYAEFDPLHSHFFHPDEANCPAVNVSYEEATLYARWLGKRIPSEFEWEKAARGTDGRLFPWGNDFDGALVNSGESERRAPIPVDELSAGASPYGCLQMSGNVWEWTSTPWEAGSPLMAKKGGCALNFEPLMHCSARFEDPPEMRLRWAGFRLVHDGPG